MDIRQIQQALQQFVDERDWQQFHSPKNLAMALSVEASELLEHFQWLSEDQSKHLPQETLDEVAFEIADVQVYLLRLADQLNIDIEDAVKRKMLHNAEKYPVDISRGNAVKYNRRRTDDRQES
ncbi:MAG: hypothetical protein RIQ52_1785 [Pseudomonadota bacterium]